MFFFFFSSRRRHTRFSRDWSSDVCSSDLGGARSKEKVGPNEIDITTAGTQQHLGHRQAHQLRIGHRLGWPGRRWPEGITWSSISTYSAVKRVSRSGVTTDHGCPPLMSRSTLVAALAPIRNHSSSEAPPLTAEVDGSACSAVLRGSGWDRSD